MNNKYPEKYLQLAAQAWQHDLTEEIQMDSYVAIAVADLIYNYEGEILQKIVKVLKNMRGKTIPIYTYEIIIEELKKEFGVEE